MIFSSERRVGKTFQKLIKQFVDFFLVDKALPKQYKDPILPKNASIQFLGLANHRSIHKS